MISKIISSLAFDYYSNKWKKKYSTELEKFRDIHKGDDCFIIGNGPSLNKMDLSLLNDYYSFGLNKIFLIFKRVNLKLSYHVAVNSLVIEQSKKDIENLGCSSFLAFGPAQRNKIKGKFINYIGETRPIKAFYKDITQGINQGCTVTNVAMQIAYFMGFNRVFLIGVDHSFNQTGKPNEKQIMKNDDENHFDPNYFKGKAWHLADLESSEISYLTAKYYFEKDGRKIYDATVDGKLDIFPKIDFQESLNTAKKKAK